jgi:hypothetical protein
VKVLTLGSPLSLSLSLEEREPTDGKRTYRREQNLAIPKELDDEIIFAKQDYFSGYPESKTSSLSSIANVQSKLIAVGTKDRPPTNMEEKRKQVGGEKGV